MQDQGRADQSIISRYSFFNELQELPFVDQIVLFGSRARGDNAERADIDIAITCPHAGPYDWQKVMNIIDDADTLLKIDCVCFDRLSDTNALKQAILKEGMTLF